jgi:hypothetical protein
MAEIAKRMSRALDVSPSLSSSSRSSTPSSHGTLPSPRRPATPSARSDVSFASSRSTVHTVPGRTYAQAAVSVYQFDSLRPYMDHLPADRTLTSDEFPSLFNGNRLKLFPSVTTTPVTVAPIPGRPALHSILRKQCPSPTKVVPPPPSPAVSSRARTPEGPVPSYSSEYSPIELSNKLHHMVCYMHVRGRMSTADLNAFLAVNTSFRYLATTRSGLIDPSLTSDLTWHAHPDRMSILAEPNPHPHRSVWEIFDRLRANLPSYVNRNGDFSAI